MTKQQVLDTIQKRIDEKQELLTRQNVKQVLRDAWVIKLIAYEEIKADVMGLQ